MDLLSTESGQLHCWSVRAQASGMEDGDQRIDEINLKDVFYVRPFSQDNICNTRSSLLSVDAIKHFKQKPLRAGKDSFGLYSQISAHHQGESGQGPEAIT